MASEPGKILPQDVGLAFPRRLKAKRAVLKASKPEAVTQRQAEAYCALRGLETFHMPEYVLNAAFGWKANRTGPEMWAMKNASQDVKGLPDLLIFDPKHPGDVLSIESKTEIGKMSPFQKIWQKRLGTKECRSFEAVKKEVDFWMESLAGKKSLRHR